METQCIAVIEDDDATLDVTELLLAVEGYHPIAFRTRADATHGMPMHHFALVIVDLHLERPAAGLELVDALRADAATAQVPILLWSADPDLATIVTRHHLEGMVVRLKPVLPRDLLRLVAGLVKTG